MKTLVLDHKGSSFLVGAAHVAKTAADVELAAEVPEWQAMDRSNPWITWVAGDFVEGDKANSNRQFWTAGDLEMAEYSIRYAPLNMVHRFRQPVGFFAQTRNVPLNRLQVAGADVADPATGSMKIRALSGMWSHIFPMETIQVFAADDTDTLFFSMECIGSHLRCAGPNGCAKEFAYANYEDHCQHLRERTSIRHIVNPVFRGGALIVPPTKPGWKEARATVIDDELLQAASLFAEQTHAQVAALDNGNLTAAGWEQLMAMVLATKGAPN